jgi:hypothetical protein
LQNAVTNVNRPASGCHGGGTFTDSSQGRLIATEIVTDKNLSVEFADQAIN